MNNRIDSSGPVYGMPISASIVSGVGALLRRLLARPKNGPPALDADTAFGALVDLDAHLLADIGAPDSMLALSMAGREVRQQERDFLRLGVVSSAWPHW